MSDALLFISWAGLVPVTLQAAAVSGERVEVEIKPICVLLPHGFIYSKDVMDNHICCRKERELYTLLSGSLASLCLYIQIYERKGYVQSRDPRSCPWDKN